MIDEREYICNECTRIQLMRDMPPNTIHVPVVTHDFLSSPHKEIPPEVYALSLDEQERHFRYTSRILTQNAVPMMFMMNMGQFQAAMGLRGLVGQPPSEDMTLENVRRRAKRYGLEVDIDDWVSILRGQYDYPKDISSILVKGTAMWNRMDTVEMLMLALNCENVHEGSGLSLIWGQQTPIRVG
jgi:hypothetical protein